jgi:NAD(P)-dependent dehydrogenase (short-subunit alcohol dehydrogenase family)
VAIVTGAGAGLGRAYALELASRGAKVVVNDLGGARDGSGDGSAAPADQVVSEIKAAGGEAVANYDNVATAEGGEAIVKTALDSLRHGGHPHQQRRHPARQEFCQDGTGELAGGAGRPPQRGLQRDPPGFCRDEGKGYGRIVMTTSAAGLYGNFGQTNYTAAKLAWWAS